MSRRTFATGWKNNSWIRATFGCERRPKIDRVYKDHAPAPPSFTLLDEFFLFKVNWGPGRSDWFTGYIEQFDTN